MPLNPESIDQALQAFEPVGKITLLDDDQKTTAEVREVVAAIVDAGELLKFLNLEFLAYNQEAALIMIDEHRKLLQTWFLRLQELNRYIGSGKKDKELQPAQKDALLTGIPTIILRIGEIITVLEAKREVIRPGGDIQAEEQLDEGADLNQPLPVTKHTEPLQLIQIQ
jgi:hypothetical protein